MEISERNLPHKLSIQFPKNHQASGWTVLGGGLQMPTDRVVFLYLEGSQLKTQTPLDYIASVTTTIERENAQIFLTSAHLEDYSVSSSEDNAVHAVATVGLGNALRAGDPVCMQTVGTINLCLVINRRLSPEACLEAISIATEAKCTIMQEEAIQSIQGTGVATGTGTDCICVVDSPLGETYHYSGKHTELGFSIASCTRRALRQGIKSWCLRYPSHTVLQKQ